MTRIDLIYFNAGGGHRASALALQDALLEHNPRLQVRLCNLFEVLDPTGRFQRMTGKAPEDWYNQRLARGWTLGMAQELKLLQRLVRLFHSAMVRRLERHWQYERPDLVVSLIPNFNLALIESLHRALPGAPLVTVMTDLADLPPHFWIERHPRQHLVCGSARAVQQARALGHDERTVHASSGMLLRAAFYAPRTANRADALRRLGLDPARPTGLVLFGGHGAKAMLGIQQRLADTQLILICGHNQALAQRLSAQLGRAPHVVLGFCPDIPAQMQLADFFIGKPGPGSVCEAVHMGLPVIVVDNAWTLPQERYNAQWVREHRVGLVVRDFRAIREQVARLLAQLPTLRRHAAAVHNRARFEVPLLLERILREAGQAAVAPGGLAQTGQGRAFAPLQPAGTLQRQQLDQAPGQAAQQDEPTAGSGQTARAGRTEVVHGVLNVGLTRP